MDFPDQPHEMVPAMVNFARANPRQSYSSTPPKSKMPGGPLAMPRPESRPHGFRTWDLQRLSSFGLDPTQAGNLQYIIQAADHPAQLTDKRYSWKAQHMCQQSLYVL